MKSEVMPVLRKIKFCLTKPISKLRISLPVLVILMAISGCNLFRPAPGVCFKRALQNKPYDVIIVPGVPFDGNEWSPIMKGRVLWALYLIDKGIAKNVIFSGGAVYTPYVEGKIMALYAEAMGMPKDRIIIESKAEHSTENVYNSYWIAKDKGYKKIALATDPYQSNLLTGFTKRRFKLPITLIPYILDTVRTLDAAAPKINPASAHVENFVSIEIRETKRQRWRGTKGKDIKFRKE